MVLSENRNFLCGLPYIVQIAHRRECILDIKAAREAEKVAFNRAGRVVILGRHIVWQCKIYGASLKSTWDCNGSLWLKVGANNWQWLSLMQNQITKPWLNGLNVWLNSKFEKIVFGLIWSCICLTVYSLSSFKLWLKLNDLNCDHVFV
mgnify:CR=1 FL=1